MDKQAAQEDFGRFVEMCRGVRGVTFGHYQHVSQGGGFAYNVRVVRIEPIQPVKAMCRMTSDAERIDKKNIMPELFPAETRRDRIVFAFHVQNDGAAGIVE